LMGPAPESRLVVGWKRGTDDAALKAFLEIVAK